MRRGLALLGLLLLALPAGAWAQAPAPGGGVLLLTVDGDINRATQNYLEDGLKVAQARGSSAVLLELNTPGGGLAETFAITDAIANAPLPVIGYVAPRTATAWSAGTIILLSTHVAAMAPFTVIGSSQPVELGGGGFTPINDTKVINALVGKLQALAKAHGRNETAAGEFVTKNLNLDADAAKAAGVIEVVANNEAALLQALDGRSVETAAGNVTLHTAGAALDRYDPSLRVALLEIFYDPVIAGILMLVGIYALIFGLSTPGMGAEVAGAIVILLALVGLGFNVSFVGVGLIVLGAALLLIELHVGHGVLGIAGIVVLILGTLFLAPLGPGGPRQFAFPASYQQQALLVLALPSLVLAAFLAFGLYKVREVRKRAPLTLGPIGQEAVVTEALGPGKEGFVTLQGERWQAVSEWEAQPGQRVVVRGKDGPVLRVEPAGQGSTAPP